LGYYISASTISQATLYIRYLGWKHQNTRTLAMRQ